MKSLLQYWASQVEQLSDLFLSFKTSNPQSVPSHYPTVSENTRCLCIETIDVFGAFLEAASVTNRDTATGHVTGPYVYKPFPFSLFTLV